MKKKFKFWKSEKAYATKPNPAFIKWEQTEGDDYDMYNLSKSGYTLCWNCLVWGRTHHCEQHNINKWCYVRRGDKWSSSNFVYIDLDGVDITWTELCQKLMNNPTVLRPNYMYTTFHHRKTINGEYKGNRYRLVYYFEEPITDKVLFQNISLTLNLAIKKYFNIEDENDKKVDNHNTVLAQPMHGTGRNGLSQRCSTIHKAYLSIDGWHIASSKGDLLVVSTFVKDINLSIHIDTQSGKSGKSIEVKDLFSKDERTYIRTLYFKDYLSENCNKYILYQDNWQSLGNEAKMIDVISVKPSQRWNKEKRQYEPYVIPDGGHRRNKLFSVAIKLKRLNISRDEMLYNLVYWMYHYTSGNSVDPITWNDLLDLTNKGMASDPIESKKKCFDVLVKNNKNPYAIIKNPYINERRKYERMEDRVRAFNNLESKDITSMIKEMKVSKSTAYRIKKKACDKEKFEKEAIFSFFKEGLGVKEIMEKTGLGKSRVYKLKKEFSEALSDKAEQLTTSTPEKPQKVRYIGNLKFELTEEEYEMVMEMRKEKIKLRVVVNNNNK